MHDNALPLINIIFLRKIVDQTTRASVDLSNFQITKYKSQDSFKRYRYVNPKYIICGFITKYYKCYEIQIILNFEGTNFLSIYFNILEMASNYFYNKNAIKQKI